jgi:hypothetical protein
MMRMTFSGDPAGSIDSLSGFCLESAKEVMAAKHIIDPSKRAEKILKSVFFNRMLIDVYV